MDNGLAPYPCYNTELAWFNHRVFPLNNYKNGGAEQNDHATDEFVQVLRD
jgi:hypothetical protein